MQSETQEPTSTPARPGVITSAALRALCVDLYGRPPSAEERGDWIGRPRKAFVEHAFGTEEAWRHWLDEQLYYFMLIDRFRPVGTTLDELPRLLAKRAMPLRDALHRIALCTSFDLRNPGADTFVTVVMEQLCGLDVTRARRELELGKRAYDGAKAVFLGEPAASQADVVKVAARHRDAARHFIEREHQRITGEAVDRKTRNKAASRIVKDPRRAVDLVASWYESEAYARRIERGRPVSNRVWVRMMLQDLGWQSPAADEVEALRSALDGLGDPAPLRSAIVRMALQSSDVKLPTPARTGEAAADLVRSTFDRLLGRVPRADELEAFGEVVRTEDGPGAMLYVLMTSEEYETP